MGGGRVEYPFLHFLKSSAPCLCVIICLDRPVSAPYILYVMKVERWRMEGRVSVGQDGSIQDSTVLAQY